MTNKEIKLALDDVYAIKKDHQENLVKIPSEYLTILPIGLRLLYLQKKKPALM